MKIVIDLKTKSLHPLSMEKFKAGKFIKSMRLVNNVTRESLAEKSKISQSCISKIENGILDPGLKEFSRILNVLGLELIIKSKGNKEHEQ